MGKPTQKNFHSGTYKGYGSQWFCVFINAINKVL